ncbi:NAD(P)/FAD-dependent oxidoreductase [Roseibium litorale]|uniref:FAD-binding oxidoreductase n=1 Tax=Roseibium litorale TaxID=2803841 RepID=A0ABR9CTI3_9HYPH|nr:FAD-binding oxidoreductase [Roseibium litorale]MBD8894013.1 FAD-binding oxidoreductase [Roseibium litorale]
MASTRPRYDLAVVGAGVFGLSIAREALRQGLSVIVLEKDKVGAGSSGGLLGALMPHMPARWNPKKAFQFAALSSLEAHALALEEETGVSTGYARCGRILPLTTQDKLDHHLERAEEALERWRPEETGFRYQVEPAGSRSGWLSPEAAPFGLVHETLAARMSPRGCLQALARFIDLSGKGKLLEGAEVTGFDETTGRIALKSGAEEILAERLVAASGHQAFPVIAELTGQMIGRGEKGQALLMEGKGLEDRPAIYCDGLYVVPHENGTVAIGSTSDREFTDASVDPERTRELVERATAFCPSLKGRDVTSVWAGIRPRCNRRDPLVGLLPGYKKTFAATGGFKISFGIAHLVAECLVAEITGREAATPLPGSFRPAAHFG